jgi:hypothetical protein
MIPPIIIVEHGDVTIFDSVSKAQIGIEPIDVINGEYIAYDKDGRVLHLEVQKDEKLLPLFGKITIESVAISDVEKGACHSGELRRVLINYLRNVGIYEQEDDARLLSDLVDKAATVARVA